MFQFQDAKRAYSAVLATNHPRVTHARINSSTCFKFYLDRVEHNRLWEEVDESSGSTTWIHSPAKGQQKPKAQPTVSGRKGNREEGVRDSAEGYRVFCVFQ